MTNRLSFTNLNCVVGKKCKGFLRQVEYFRDAMRPTLFLFLFLGFFYESIQWHSSQCHST